MLIYSDATTLILSVAQQMIKIGSVAADLASALELVIGDQYVAFPITTAKKPHIDRR